MERRSARKCSGLWDEVSRLAASVTMLTAIIVAGGSSRRMGFDKTFALLADKPVIAHTIAAFASASCVGEIIIVGRAERLDELRELAPTHRVVAGGVHRQDSVAAGLAALTPACRYVAVHDAARPLVTTNAILRVLEAAQTHGAAALAAPITDTLKRADADHFVTEAVDRDGVFAMQTPQIFARDLLEEAYARIVAAGLTVTDEVSAVEQLGRKVILVPNDKPNPKITFPADLALAELLLAGRAACA
ncbi:MAG: 2-C-methyl-D-erythritol 4-phosphate cytidylyltransferase [Chthoniobacterales bacterium]